VTGNITANSISANSISSEVLKGVIFKSDDTAAALKFSDNNEINFGSNGDTLFLGYDATRISADNGAVGNYRFGNSTGSTGMMAGKIYCGEVYVDNGTTKVAREHSHPYLKTDTSDEQSVLGLINAAGFKGNSFSSKTKGTDGACIVANTSGTALLYGASAATAAYEIATKKDIQDLIEIDSTGTKLIINI
jgi:hypothetical protein